METNVNQKMTIVQKIEQTSPAALAALPEVADRFKTLYHVMNGANPELAQVAYESERFHFSKLLQDKPELQKCTKLSLYGCFIDMAVVGLSFDPAMKHAYIVAFPTNVGTKDNPKWETRATLMIDGRGELVIRTRQGQIKYADNPVVVFEGDVFKYGTRNEKIFVEHEAVFPRKSENILACYLRIERPDGSVDYKVFGIEDVMLLREFSKQKESLAWTKGLRGMVETKTIKHAFKSYPKVKLGSFSQLKSEAVEPELIHAPVIDYGLNGHTAAALPKVNEQASYQPTMIVEPAGAVDESFDKPSGKPANTVSFEDDEF